MACNFTSQPCIYMKIQILGSCKMNLQRPRRELVLLKQRELRSVLSLNNRKWHNNHSMRRALEVLLLVSILSLALSYLYSCLPRYLHSVTSLLHSLNHFTTRKAMFLFSNVILLFLTIKGSGFTPTTSLNEPFDGVSHSTRKDEDDHLLLSDEMDSVEVGGQIVEKGVIKESVVLAINSRTELSVTRSVPSIIKGNEMVALVEGQVDNKVKEMEVSNQSRVRGDNTRGAEGEIRSQIKGTRVAVRKRSFLPEKWRGWDFQPSYSKEVELDLLDIDDLNKRFDEFIEREKSKRRLEAN